MRPVELGGRGLFGDKGQLRTLRSEADDGGRAEIGFGDALAVQVRSVGAVEVADTEAGVLAANLEVLEGNAGDVGALNDYVVLRTPADAGDVVAERMPDGSYGTRVRYQPGSNLRDSDGLFRHVSLLHCRGGQYDDRNPIYFIAQP